MSENDVLIAGSAIVGLVLIVLRKKRQFSRLNQYGIEHFTSFGHKVRAMALDVLLLGAGLGLLGAAVTVYLTEYAQPLVAGVFLLLIIWFFSGEHDRIQK